MKKLYTILMAMLLAINVFAGQQLFEKHRRHQHELLKSLQSHKKIMTQKALENVPGLTKTSSWDGSNNSWMGTNAQIQIANNNRITTTYYTSYNLVDTFNRITYTYDNQGRYLSSLTESKGMNGQYGPQSRVSFTYSTDGLTQIILVEQYDSFTSTWRNDSKIIMSKNDRGEETRMIYYFFNNNDWEISFGYATKITYLNSNSIKTTEVIDSTFDFNTKTMKALYKITQGYDANERAVDIRYYEEDFSTGSLIYTTQDSVFYDNNGLPTVVIEKEVDAAGNATDILKFNEITWVNFNPNINLFDNYPSGYKVYFKLFNSWSLVGRSSTTFPNNYGSRITLDELYESGNYIPDQKSTELYNYNFDLIEEKYETFDVDSNFWIVNNGNKYLITYDANNNQTEYISQFYESNSKQYVNSERKEYSNFILVNTGIADSKNSTLNVYPNPVTSDEIKIKHQNFSNENSKIFIYDLSGKLIKEINAILDGTETNIQLEKIEKGAYILKHETKNEISIAKIIKQ